MRAIRTPLLLLILGLASSLHAAPLKNDTAKKPCPAPRPSGKTAPPPAASDAAATSRDWMEPGFGRKVLDLSFVAKAKESSRSKT
jgi:hypothetical protein